MAIDDNTSYELTGYQVKDLASKIRAKADSNSLASVATSGLYSDLTGAPTIPTVYNGTLTIQQNGTTLGTFSANQSSNETINITTGGGGASVTKFYSSEYSDNANVTLYKDTSFTTHATYQEVIDALQGGGIEWVTIDNSVQSVFLPTFYKVDATSFSPDTLIYVTFVKQSNPIIVQWNTVQSNLSSNAVFGTQIGRYTLPTASSSTLGGIKVGSNLSISSGVLSANAMTGATSGTDGAAGYVPQPLIADESKYLKGDGTWDTPPNTTYTAGSNINIDANNEISATDTTYSNFTGATSSVAGANGLVPAPAAGDQGKALKGDGTWGEFSEQFVIMKYGEANAWAKFIDAYSKNKIVYCRASSNSNPGTGSQTRMAFMAYVSNETTPTNVEFQYVRSVGSKTSSQPVDQVFIYKLESTNGGTWSVQTRDMAPKLAAGTGASVSYGSGTYTVGMSAMTGATSGAAGAGGAVPDPAAGDQDKVLKADATWGKVGAGNIDFTTMPVYTDSVSNVALSTSYTTLAKVTVVVPGKYLLLLDASSNSISSSYSLYSRFAIDTSTYNGNYVTVPGGGWGHTSNMCVVDISTANTDVKAEFNSTVAIAASTNTRVNLTAIRIG